MGKRKRIQRPIKSGVDFRPIDIWNLGSSVESYPSSSGNPTAENISVSESSGVYTASYTYTDPQSQLEANAPPTIESVTLESYVNQLNIYANADDGDTLTIGAKTYTLQTTLTNTDGNVLIGATASDTVDNLVAAITLGSGSGTTYAAATTAHPDSDIAALNAPDGDILRVTSSSALSCSETGDQMNWDTSALASTTTWQPGDAVFAVVSGFNSPAGYSEGSHTYEFFSTTDKSQGSETSLQDSTSNRYLTTASEEDKYLRVEVIPTQSGGANTTGTVFKSFHSTSTIDSPAAGSWSDGSVDLDGTNDDISIADINLDGDFILGGWCQPETGFSGDEGLWTELGTFDNNIRFRSGGATCTIEVGGAERSFSTDSKVSIDSPVHWVAWRDGTNLHMAFNGVESSTGSIGGAGNDATLSFTNIGRHNTQSYFHGKKQDYFCYKGTTPTAQNLLDFYNGGVARDPREVIASPTVLLKFDTGSGTTEANLGSDGGNATLNNGPTWAAAIA